MNNLHDYLRESVDYDLRVEILKNQDATRENIARLFRSHLGLADKDDVVLFYFSGHGSQEISPPEFNGIIFLSVPNPFYLGQRGPD